MPYIQIKIDNEENDIIECCQGLFGVKKPDAVKKLIRIAGEAKDIKPTLDQRKKNKLTNKK
ncbi:MAG: hypothetical protein Q7S33_04050 [Nanoarchaeota archaeon]|nr:hypothetical protein [Nanoarchaeota archaeon]